MNHLLDIESIWKEVITITPHIGWIGLAAFVSLKMLPVFREKIKNGDVDLDIGGMKVNITSVREQIIDQVKDLQDEVAELRTKVSGQQTILFQSEAIDKRKQYLQEHDVNKILWVDDTPENNAVLISKLKTDNIEVVQALSTAEAMKIYKRNRMGYDLIVSDMGRKEEGKYNAMAGLDLIMAVRKYEDDLKLDPKEDSPILIYTTPNNSKEYRNQIKEAGGDGVTSSPTKLLVMIYEFCKIEQENNIVV